MEAVLAAVEVQAVIAAEEIQDLMDNLMDNKDMDNNHMDNVN